jgi:hypothetical protein
MTGIPGYTGDFPWRGYILAVRGAKFAAVRPNLAPITVQGLPSDGTGSPRQKVQSAKFTLRLPLRGQPLTPKQPCAKNGPSRLGTGSHPLAGALPAQGVANPVDLLLEGCRAVTAQGHRRWPGHLRQTLGPERGSAEPRKARFFAEQKMRPNNTMQGEAR